MHLFPAGAGQVVSIHAPAWGATNAFAFRAYNYIVFQSTHPRGVRPMRQATSDKEDAMFQSTHPRGVRRTRRRRQSRLSQCFNPRTRVGCDSPPTNRIFAAQEFQSTHPRGVRLAALLGLSIRVTVSIHAPAWGATGQQLPGNTSHVKFQSTHPRGVRRLPLNRPNRISRFQSTHPRGVRPFPRRLGKDGALVSIHAPAWGATRRVNDAALRGLVSIHAPAWGATLISVYVAIF